MIFPYGAMINCDTVSAPVEGLKLILVDETFCGKLPVLAVTQVGYTTAFVAVSSVIAVFVAFVAVVAVAALPPIDKPDAVPVIFVPTKADGVPKAGVTNVGLVAKTTLPLPVELVSVGAVAKPATPVEVTNCGVVVAFPAKNNVVLSAD